MEIQNKVTTFVTMAVLTQALTAAPPRPTERTTLFQQRTRCQNGVCSEEDAGRAFSRTECAFRCAVNPTPCYGFHYTEHGDCYHLGQNCFLDTQCPAGPSGPQVFQRDVSCLHDGVWDPSMQSCRCLGGWVGEQCDRRADSCHELNRHGYLDGIYDVEIDVYRNLSLLIKVKCDLKSSVSLTYVFVSNGWKPHKSHWDDYVHGYIIDTYNQWLGLETLLTLNRMGHTDVIFAVRMVSPQDEYKDCIFWYRYGSFHLQDASSGYRFTSGPLVKSISGSYCQAINYTLDDILDLCQGRPFLTSDNDSLGMCAVKSETGWWFLDCSGDTIVNPLGYREELNEGHPSTIANIKLPNLDLRDSVLQKSFSHVAMYFYQDN